MSSYIRFSYQYRDAANYKRWGARCFLNPTEIPLVQIRERLSNSAIDGVWFNARQIDVPELFLFLEMPTNDDDHCFHEIDTVDVVTEKLEAVDSRTICEFLVQVESAASRGWEQFDPLTLRIQP